MPTRSLKGFPPIVRRRQQSRRDGSWSTACDFSRANDATSLSRRRSPDVATHAGFAICTSGYRTHLVFVSLPSADLAVGRVAERARRGGHDVPEPVVRRRFTAGLMNLFETYVDAVDGWQVYDNAGLSGPRLIASSARGQPPAIADALAWSHLQEQHR